MKVEMSAFLESVKPSIKKLIKILEKDFEYVSVLGTDSNGKLYLVQKTGITIQDSFWNERGFVVRVYNGINYSEYAFNEIDFNNIEKLAADLKNKFIIQLEGAKKVLNIPKYEVIMEDEMHKEFIGELEDKIVNDSNIVEKMIDLKEKAFKLSEKLLDCRVRLQKMHISKIFLSSKKDLSQTYVWSEGSVLTIVREGNNTKFNYDGFSGLKGAELLDEIDYKINDTVKTAVKLLDATSVKPGEYEVICSPDVSGIIAHEAFGHGVEMDMFVKNRAKAAEYVGKSVASKLVTMHDGASAAKQVSSYLFDDEGVIGKDTVIIDKGILKSGISDTISALKLGAVPTGNGKRQSYDRKAYTRMTNTFFSQGEDNLDEMIASIKFGYLLDCATSGMEDPKNWGIQCMVNYGMEIKDGKLTGKIVSPVVLTGYVPDLLKSISMVSKNVELKGTGACGKGYKELVKVSSGGPYIKAKVRLG